MKGVRFLSTVSLEHTFGGLWEVPIQHYNKSTETTWAGSVALRWYLLINVMPTETVLDHTLFIIDLKTLIPSLTVNMYW